MSVVNYLKKVQLPNNTEYTVKDPTFFTGTTEEWNLLSTEEKQSYQIVNLTDDEEEGDISEKADKVSGATNGNLAGLNGSGNLTDSGWNGAKDATSISGNPISISSLKSNQLAINPVITFEPIETGTGTKSPSNPWTISGYDKVEVLSCGKNLFDGTYSATGKYLNSSGEEVGGGFNISQYISVKASTAYYFTNLSNPTSACICWYNKAKEFISSNAIWGTGITFTSPINASYVRASVHNAKTDVCINEGNTAITYVPYDKTTSISESLGQTVYGGSDEIRTGELISTHKLGVLGDLSWGNFSTGVFRAYATADVKMDVASHVCEIYTCTNNYNTMMATNNTFCIITSGNERRIFVHDDRYSDYATFAAAVTGVKYAYELATPTEIQLTPHEIPLLKDYSYVSTNGTSIALDYHNGEMASLADVSQLGETVNELGDKLGIVKLEGIMSHDTNPINLTYPLGYSQNNTVVLRAEVNKSNIWSDIYATGASADIGIQVALYPSSISVYTRLSIFNDLPFRIYVAKY